jgi:hypothetical protein
VVGVVVALVVLAVLGRLLIGSQEPSEPTYDAVPDARLYADIAGLRGVTDVQVDYDAQAAPAAYSGTVTVDASRRLCPVLDQVFAILRQGHQDAAIDVEVVRTGGDQSPRRSLTMQDVDAAVAADPGSRYGAQPGTGEPLDDQLCASDS